MVVWWVVAVVAVVWCVVAAGVVAVVRAVPTVSQPPVQPAGDDPNTPVYCLSCDHTHAEGGMAWNDELQFRCVDCCSDEAMSRASLAIGSAYSALIMSPEYQEARMARLRREAAEFNAVFWAEQVREYQQQYPAIADRLGRLYPSQLDRAA